MGDFSYIEYATFEITLVDNPPATFYTYSSTTPGNGTITDLDDDNQFESGDSAGGSFGFYQGNWTFSGIEMPVFQNGNFFYAFNPGPSTATYSTQNSPPVAPNTYTFCFAAGTRIGTPDGERTVETLRIGDPVLTEDGRAVPVRWIGRQTLHKLSSGPNMQPVRIRAGALGDGLPHSDLTVTADHGMVIDGLVINAAALVNGATIDWVPMDELPDRVTYYHVETEAHDVILANGAPAETFIDYAGRQAFDNYAEYVELYGAERLIAEMDRPRISARRLVPDAIKARLGIVEPGIDWDEALRA